MKTIDLILYCLRGTWACRYNGVDAEYETRELNAETIELDSETIELSAVCFRREELAVGDPGRHGDPRWCDSYGWVSDSASQQSEQFHRQSL